MPIAQSAQNPPSRTATEKTIQLKLAHLTHMFLSGKRCHLVSIEQKRKKMLILKKTKNSTVLIALFYVLSLAHRKFCTSAIRQAETIRKEAASSERDLASPNPAALYSARHAWPCASIRSRHARSRIGKASVMSYLHCCRGSGEGAGSRVGECRSRLNNSSECSEKTTIPRRDDYRSKKQQAMVSQDVPVEKGLLDPSSDIL